MTCCGQQKVFCACRGWSVKRALGLLLHDVHGVAGAFGGDNARADSPLRCGIQKTCNHSNEMLEQGQLGYAITGKTVSALGPSLYVPRPRMQQGSGKSC